MESAANKGHESFDATGPLRVSSQGKEALSKLISSVEGLLLLDAAAPELARVRVEVEVALAAAKRAISDGLLDRLRRQGHEVLEASDRYVRNQPWAVIGMAVTAAALVGLVLGRRGMRKASLSTARD
jgi:ElaB/YqjD/DUF883 family membrane-anchored ribosome-binding protein